MLTLLREGNPLAQADEQNRLLDRVGISPFSTSLRQCGHWPLSSTGIDVLQVNVGKLCNQTCAHCHVDAGPERREVMTRDTVQACLRFLAESEISTLDITGGAPEMNPHFRWLAAEARQLKRRVIDRCNLTILTAPGYEDLGVFLADHQIEIVASLPCYLEENTDLQRGAGVFSKSIRAIQELNRLGYGRDDAFPLTLVFNPVGPSLPPNQERLEADDRRELRQRYDIEFTRLITITNLPISRFLESLVRSGQFEKYMELLANTFNPAAVEGVMCRNTLSVGWDGRLYDCDFNQMLELPLGASESAKIQDVTWKDVAARTIRTGQHCYGCTAGSGSGCQGALTRI